MKDARVTVLMTLYNKGPYVTAAIESVLAGTFTDFELLVVDDGSTDDGPTIVQRITDPRVRLLANATNTGRAAAANRGYDAARGEYVAVLDADDLSHPARLAKQVAFLDAHPDVGVCGTYAQVFGIRNHVATWPLTDKEARGLLLFEDPLLYGSAMFRRSVLEEHTLRCRAEWRHPGMDYLFLLAVAKHTRTATLPEALMSYRIGDQNFRYGRDALADRARVHREVFRFYGIDAGAAEADLQLMLHQQFRKPPSAVDIRSLWAWINRLNKFNREHQLFTEDIFEARLDKEWKRLYYICADRWLGPALTHLRISGGWPMGRLAYLLKVRLRKLLGR